MLVVVIIACIFSLYGVFKFFGEFIDLFPEDPIAGAMWKLKNWLASKEDDAFRKMRREFRDDGEASETPLNTNFKE